MVYQPVLPKSLDFQASDLLEVSGPAWAALVARIAVRSLHSHYQLGELALASCHQASPCPLVGSGPALVKVAVDNCPRLSHLLRQARVVYPKAAVVVAASCQLLCRSLRASHQSLIILVPARNHLQRAAHFRAMAWAKKAPTCPRRLLTSDKSGLSEVELAVVPAA